MSYWLNSEVALHAPLSSLQPRFSDLHHAKDPILVDLSASPQLPMVPPLWFAVMNPRLGQTKAHFHPDEALTQPGVFNGIR